MDGPVIAEGGPHEPVSPVVAALVQEAAGVGTASQVSLDYYDASGTLTRPGAAPNRRRHASSGAVIENGNAKVNTENGRSNDISGNYISTPCVAGKVFPNKSRYSAHCDTQMPCASNPHSKYCTPYGSDHFNYTDGATTSRPNIAMDNSAFVQGSSDSAGPGTSDVLVHCITERSLYPKISASSFAPDGGEVVGGSQKLPIRDMKEYLPNYVECADVTRDPLFSGRLKGFQDMDPGCRKSFPSVSHKGPSSGGSSYSPLHSKALGNLKGQNSTGNSSLSLNFAWKKNYVPFTNVSGDESAQEQSLLQDVSPIKVDSPSPDDQCHEKLSREASWDCYKTFYEGDDRGSWRDELSLSNLSLSHPSPHLFVTAQWQRHHRMSCLYLGYRLFWALYFCMWAPWSLAASSGYDAPWSVKLYYLTYLTNWSIWLLAVDTLLQSVNVVLHMRRLAHLGDARYHTTPRYMQVSWALSNITFTTHCFITIAYWATVYPFSDDHTINVININKHVIAGMYVLLDVFISGTPRRVLHFLYPLLYFATYFTFNYIYFLAGGTDYRGRPYLYPYLDWANKPGISIGLLAAVLLVIAPLLHLTLCCLYAFRVWLWKKYSLPRYACVDAELDKGIAGFDEQGV